MYLYMYNNKELETFHKNLKSETNKKDIILSQYFFYLSTILPFIMYHFNNNNFPCTLSDTISSKEPKIVHHITWLIGWLFLLKVIFKSGCSIIKLFSIIMLSTVIIASIIYPIDRKKKNNKIHYICSFLYMLLHIVMFKILNIKNIYVNYFNLYFFLLVITSSNSKKNLKKVRQIIDFIFMISEYFLFLSFISGMTSNFNN